MVEAAWATWRTATRPGARFRRLARRFGKGNEKKAAVAVAHPLLCIAWAVMRYDAGYINARARTSTSGATSATASTWSATTRTHWPGSASQVILTPPGDGAPPTPTPDNPGQAT